MIQNETRKHFVSNDAIIDSFVNIYMARNIFSDKKITPNYLN